MAIGRSPSDRPCPDGASGAGTVLDHELVAERLAHVLGEQARQDVVAAPRRERHHDGDRTGRIDLRCSRPGCAYLSRDETGDEGYRDSRKSSRSHGTFRIGTLSSLPPRGGFFTSPLPRFRSPDGAQRNPGTAYPGLRDRKSTV